MKSILSHFLFCLLLDLFLHLLNISPRSVFPSSSTSPEEGSAPSHVGAFESEAERTCQFALKLDALTTPSPASFTSTISTRSSRWGCSLGVDFSRGFRNVAELEEDVEEDASFCGLSSLAGGSSSEVLFKERVQAEERSSVLSSSSAKR